MGDGKLNKTDHVPGEWKMDDEYHWFICEECGEIINKEKHHMGKWKVIKEPTKTETGMKARYCEDCEHMETKVIPVIAEDPVNPQPEVKDNTVNTADNSHLMFWTGLAGLSILLMLRLKKKINLE